MNIEGKEIETYKTFVVPLDNTKFKEKVYLTMRNYPVTSNKRKIARGGLDNEEAPTDSES